LPIFGYNPAISDPATGNDAKHAAPSATAGAEQGAGGKFEITLSDEALPSYQTPSFA
jgi:hypothetical protein